MGFSFNYDHSARETDGGTGSDTMSLRYATNLRYTFIPKYLNFSTNYSASESQTQGSETTGGRNYSLSLSSTPLDTLNGNFTYSHSASLTASTVTSERDSMAISTYMQLYRGIDLGLGTTLSTSQNPQQDSSSESRSYRWNLKLIPWHPLTVLLNGSYSSSASDKQGVTTSASSDTLDLTFSFSPTRTIHMGGAIDIRPVSSQSYSLTWLATRKTHIGLRYSTSIDTKGMGASFNWNPFPMLTLNMGYNVTEKTNVTNDRSESFFGRASFVF